jgi:hypothetical protein
LHDAGRSALEIHAIVFKEKKNLAWSGADTIVRKAAMFLLSQ